MSVQLTRRPSPTAAATTSPALTPCVEFAGLFLHPLMDEPPRLSAPAATRHRAEVMTRQAEQICASCPVRVACLYRAVAEYDVSGFVAGTTAKQRAAIRARLQLTVHPEDFDTLAGVTGGNRQIDHDEVIRLRNAHPDESLETLARRLGCSLSTVKRHLRQERHQPSVRRPTRRPTTTEVVAAAAEITGRRVPRSRAA